jgi:hypothetical protein
MFSSLILLSGLVASTFAHPTVEPRASCTFTDAASAIKNKGSCSTIVLNNIAVPAGTTLDLTKLKDGTHVSCPALEEILYLTILGHLSRKDYFWICYLGGSLDRLHRKQSSH